MVNSEISSFLSGKSEHTLALYHHFISEFQKAGEVTVHPAKTMIGIANAHKRIAYVTHFGKNFLDAVFLFKQRYDDNLCFRKIIYMPGMFSAVTHHLRIYQQQDVNNEVRKFMEIAYND